MIRLGFLVQHGLPQRSMPRKTLAPACLTPSIRTFWLIRVVTSLEPVYAFRKPDSTPPP